MDITEIKRRIAILEKKKSVTINKRMLRGGMDHRNRRRTIGDYNDNLKEAKKKYSIALNNEEKKKNAPKLIEAFSAQSAEPTLEEVFIKPKLGKTRIGGRGWI